MTISSDESNALADFRRRARELVGIDRSPETGEWRARLLRQVDAADYVPGPAWNDAIGMLRASDAASPANCGPALHREIESQLAEEAAEFANRFFAIAPPEREARWRNLTERTRFWPVLFLWLSRLQPGVAIALPRIAGEGDNDLAELVERIARLFPQRPDLRARLAGARVESFSERPQLAKAAAVQLRAAYPEFAALVPQLLDELILLPSRQKQMARFRAACRRRQNLWHRAGRFVWSNVRRPARAFRIPAIIAVMWIVKTLIQVSSPNGISPPNGRYAAQRYPNVSLSPEEMRKKLEKDIAEGRPVGRVFRRL